MNIAVVRVPEALLLHRQLSKSAKLVWMVLQLVSGADAATLPRSGILQANSGLSRHTVLQALSQLRAQGWLPNPEQGPGNSPGAAVRTATEQGPGNSHGAAVRTATEQGPGSGPGAAANERAVAPQCDTARKIEVSPAAAAEAHVPVGLLLDRGLSAQARLLCAILLRAPSCRSGQGQSTYNQLCSLAGVSPNTVKRAVQALRANGWLEVSQRNKFSPIHFRLCNPVASHEQDRLAQMVKGLKAGTHRGEALMRAYLSLLVASDEHDDDASPAFLVNPFTGEEMQFDRYYPRMAAFEFNGSQHYQTTQRYPDEIELLKQQARDHMKRLICAKRGLPLVVVHAEDLSLAGMSGKVAGRLPLRDLKGYGAVITYLEKVSRSYRQNAQEGRIYST